MRTGLFLISFTCLIAVQAHRLEGPIDVGIAQWQPVAPGKWTLFTKTFAAGQERDSSRTSTQDGVSACPYLALLFLRSHASVKLGEPGCQFRTYGVSKDEHHIVARCRTLAGKDHFETTTLSVSTEGKAFSTATTWIAPTGTVTGHAKEGQPVIYRINKYEMVVNGSKKYQVVRFGLQNNGTISPTRVSNAGLAAPHSVHPSWVPGYSPHSFNGGLFAGRGAFCTVEGS